MRKKGIAKMRKKEIAKIRRKMQKGEESKGNRRRANLIRTEKRREPEEFNELSQSRPPSGDEREDTGKVGDGDKVNCKMAKEKRVSKTKIRFLKRSQSEKKTD